MTKRLSQLSGKVRTRRGERLDPDRYEFLELSQAEPNLGTPDSDGALLFSNIDGTRSFTTSPLLSGLSFKAGTLDSAIGGTHVLTLSGDPNDGITDVVQVSSIESLLNEELQTLQDVTDLGNITTNNIFVNGLSIDNVPTDLTTENILVLTSSDSVAVRSLASFGLADSEVDTLQTVTNRGQTTTVDVTFAKTTHDSVKATVGFFDTSDRQLIIYDSADNVLWGS